MAKVTRNGKTYDSGDVEVFVTGLEFEVTSITYGNEQEHQLNYSLGNKASSWSRGKVTPSCTIGVAMHDITPLEKAGGGLLNIAPFYVIVTFTNEYNEIITDKLLVKFQNEGREVTGEMGLRRDYEMFALDVALNVA